MEVSKLRQELIHTYVETGNHRVLDDVDTLDNLMLKYFGQAWSFTQQDYE